MTPLKIIKNRSDIGAGSRGSDLGIDALEISAINANNDFFNRHPYLDVPTHNETIYDKVNHTFAKRINFVAEQCERVSEATTMVLKQKHFPLVLSGDHSSALGTIAGIKQTYPNKSLGVVWIDAHADLHTPLSSPSGNVHGMPLAGVLALDNKQYAINEISSSTAKSWERLKNLGVAGPKISSDHLVYFGVRDTEAAEDHVMQDLHIRNYPVHEVRHRSLTSCVEEAIDQLKGVEMIYITFDVDSLDCDLISHGTGTPFSKGFDQNEVTQIIKKFLDTKKVVCLEVCEINPLLDEKGNKMAEVAFDIINSLF